MTTAKETLERALRAGDAWQREVNQFVDDFRRADDAARRAMVADAVEQPGGLEGLVAGVVSAL